MLADARKHHGCHARESGLLAARGALVMCDVADKQAEPTEDVFDVLGMDGARVAARGRDPERRSVSFVEWAELESQDDAASRSARHTVANELLWPGIPLLPVWVAARGCHTEPPAVAG